ncbi:MAG: hypothetical protein M3542_09480 [Acidobacteriota bacterium]|nr:hypothetical protein [Acidobacteriota bacterium]MDQ5870729.1 hypothetical protein [Acidobacteriota bacterium]
MADIAAASLQSERVLLDRRLPLFDVSKRHAVRIRAARERVFEELFRYDFGRSLSTRVLMALRGYGSRTRRAGVERGGTLPERLARFGFTPLGEDPGRELVFGLVGRFWRPRGDLRTVPAADFAGFREPGFAKAAWNLLVEEIEPGVTRLSTETRVLCFGDAARRKFLLYWRFVEPFSGVIRWSLLRGVRRAAETGSGLHLPLTP